MNALHWTLLALVAGYLAMRWAWPRVANAYARYTVLGAVAVLILAPFAWLVCAVFKDPTVLMQYTFLPPPGEWSARTLNLGNLRTLLAGEDTLQGRVYFWQYLLNSLFVASTGTVVSMFFSSLGGYALAKHEFRGRKLVMAYMLATMLLPGMLLLAPVFRLVYRLGWMDTYWALIIPGAASVFGMFLFRQAMLGVPQSLLEAARMDGATEFGIYLRVVMPLVRPMTGAYCLVSFLGAWNAFLGPQIFIQSQAKLTVPVILNQYVGVYSQQYGVFLAGTLLAIIPPAILFFALQREFVAGLTSGAVKG
jgi:ABC-type glycerol-3-phosphate transport system permease component